MHPNPVPLHKNPEEMLRIITQGTAAVVGGDFFRSLAFHVIQTTGLRYALITECANVMKTRVRTIVYIDRSSFLDNFEYDLSGTPCEIVMKGENYYCAADLEKFFPKEEGIQSYFGVPIFLSNGEVIGHIAILDVVPVSIDEANLNVLKIFAARAGAEIERKRNDEIIRDNMQRYKNLFDDSPIGMCEIDFSEVKKYVGEIKKKFNSQLSTVFEEHPEEVTECYKQIKRLKANSEQIKLFGLTTEEEYFRYMKEKFQPAEFKNLIEEFDRGNYVFEREIEIRTAAGKIRFLRIKNVLLRGSEKDWARSVLSCLDVTEQKSAEDKLRSALNEVKALKEQLEAENIYLQNEIKLDHNFDEIVSQAEAFKKVLQNIEQVANTDATVLILGESGTGKELISRAIHSISKRSNRPLVKINCAALPANLIESELFGHEKGAFTGAIAQKIGRFELAHGGTIFLDEIGELPLDLQAKLLRVLQEGELERLGSNKTVKVDVRVIAATNRDLQTSVNNKEFRSDLFYRLNVFPIYSPPLRDRKEDIPILVNHFCKKYGAKFGKRITSVSKTVINTLMEYDWPGNVRELENIIERGLIMSATNVLEAGDWLPKSTANLNTVSNADSAQEKYPTQRASLQELEKKHILEVLEKTNWKIRGEDGAAKILQLNPTTLEARMKKMGISKTK